MTKATAAELAETIYRLDGPLRWAVGEATELLRRASVRQGQSVLDVGAGTGYLSLPLARVVGDGGQVHCLDLHRELLDVLVAKAERAGLLDRLRPRSGSATSLPYPDASFDVVCSSYLLHELAGDALAALREMRRVLRPLGTVVLADYRRVHDEARRREIEAWYGAQADGGGPDEVHLRFSLDDLERLLVDAGFREITLATWLDFHMHATATA